MDPRLIRDLNTTFSKSRFRSHRILVETEAFSRAMSRAHDADPSILSAPSVGAAGPLGGGRGRSRLAWAEANHPPSITQQSPAPVSPPPAAVE